MRSSLCLRELRGGLWRGGLSGLGLRDCQSEEDIHSASKKRERTYIGDIHPVIVPSVRYSAVAHAVANSMLWGHTFDRDVCGRIRQRRLMDAPGVRTATHGNHVRCCGSGVKCYSIEQAGGLALLGDFSIVHNSTAIPVRAGIIPASPSQSLHLTCLSL